MAVLTAAATATAAAPAAIAVSLPPDSWLYVRPGAPLPVARGPILQM